MTLLGELSLLIHQPNFLSIMLYEYFRQKQYQTTQKAAGWRELFQNSKMELTQIYTPSLMSFGLGGEGILARFAKPLSRVTKDFTIFLYGMTKDSKEDPFFKKWQGPLGSC